ncbi:hypothetical protein AB162_580 [Candidatus Palibaumannia cicadellinicola]|uniref:Uncharacterized protein n=1 Tax=Candidatus Palibaumannia cicadellinicola TaxID=186490 RepID=A0A0K2BLF1_9GAMM|nr:hypothetical protein [Candidatus Baumannia cicadellinicola]AKZ66155.1 hypothetical protein AB162_580 [Candidatus Baumannia cicadellinicola]
MLGHIGSDTIKNKNIKNNSNNLSKITINKNTDSNVSENKEKIMNNIPN